MLDPKFIRQNPQIVRDGLKARNNKFDLDAFLALDAKRLELLKESEDISAAQNSIDKEIKQALKDKQDPKPKIAQSKELKVKLDGVKDQFNALDKEWSDLLLRVQKTAAPPLGGASR